MIDTNTENNIINIFFQLNFYFEYIYYILDFKHCYQSFFLLYSKFTYNNIFSLFYLIRLYTFLNVIYKPKIIQIKGINNKSNNENKNIIHLLNIWF